MLLKPACGRLVAGMGFLLGNLLKDIATMENFVIQV
jgi:hypothetical protein